MKRLLLLAALLLCPTLGFAQCVGTGGVNTVNDCAPAVSVQLGDELLAWQIGQAPHTRKITTAQILGLLSAGSGVSISTVGNSVQISATGSSVNPGLANQLAYYAAGGTVVGGLTTANSGVLVTSGAGVPSISTTLPTGLALGTPASLTLTNASGLPVAGLTGLGSGVATALGLASTGTGGMVRATSPTLVSPALGTPTALVLTNATGLPNAGLLNPSTTVNGVVCVLGSTCAISATSASITVGSTGIIGGASGAIEFNNGGVLGELTPTGTGNVVLASGASIANPTVTGSFTATGLVSVADLTSPSVTVNGTTCTLGSSCSPGASATAVTIGVTNVLSGTSGRVLFDIAGALNELPTTGSGNVVLATAASLTTPNLGTPSAAVLTNATGLPNAGLVNAAITVNGVVCTLGSPCAPPGVVSITPTLVASGIAANAAIGVLPANAFLGPFLLITETGGHPVTISVGTTLGASDVLSTQPPIAANGSLTIDIAAFSKGWFSPSAPQTLYLTTSGGGAVVTAQMFYWVIGTSGGGAAGGVTSVGLSTPNSTLTLGGTNPVTGAGTISADLNLTHANTWTGQQTLVSPVVTGSFTATGLVTNADLVNPSTTVNGQSCVLGSTCTITATVPSITVGTTTIAGGNTGRFEFNNAGVLGEVASTGSGNVVLATSPTLVTPNLGTPASGVATNLTGTAAGLTAGTATNQSGGSVAATTITASSTVSGTGFTARFASPGPIGNTLASTGAFTTLSTTGVLTTLTAAPGTNTTQAATTAYSTAAVGVETSRATTAEGLLAPKASPAISGSMVITGANTLGTNSSLLAQNSIGLQGLVVNNNGVVAMPGTTGNTSASAANLFMDSFGVVYFSTSSLRYKYAVQTYPDPLAAARKLRPIKFKSRSLADGDKWFAGFAAEEVNAAGLTEFVSYDPQGRPNGLQYGHMVALSIGAVDRLADIIDSLTARVAVLEAQLERTHKK